MTCKYFLPFYQLLFYSVHSVHKLLIFLKFSLSAYCFFAQLLCPELPVFCSLEEVKADILSLVPDLKGEDFSYFCHLSMMFTMCFLGMVFPKEIISFYYWFVEWFLSWKGIEFCHMLFLFQLKNLFSPALWGLWDVSSLSRDWNCALHSESTESYPLDLQGIPYVVLFLHSVNMVFTLMNFHMLKYWVGQEICSSPCTTSPPAVS